VPKNGNIRPRMRWGCRLVGDALETDGERLAGGVFGWGTRAVAVGLRPTVGGGDAEV